MRWVGFDMDECIGSLMPLYEYMLNLPKCGNTAEERGVLFLSLAETLYHSERNGQTWLLRPAMMGVLRIVYAAWRNRKIQGAFVYSNNGSTTLVRFVAFWMNLCIKQLFQLRAIPAVFQMAVSSRASCRQLYGMVKSFESVQTCLIAHGLPECSSVNDLLFFDDMSHELQSQIRHYIQVPPYFNHTPATSVIAALSGIGNSLNCTRWVTIVNKSLDQQAADFSRPDNQYKLEKQSQQEYMNDIAMYKAAFASFLSTQ